MLTMRKRREKTFQRMKIVIIVIIEVNSEHSSKWIPHDQRLPVG